MKDDIRQRSKSMASMPDVRLALIGAGRVGKSAISVRFLTKRFIHEYQRGVEHTYRRQIQFGNEVIDYALRDSGGLRDNASIMEWATCITVVYSITDRASFTMATTTLDELNALLGTKKSKNIVPPCLGLIANKRDLEHLREISNDEGKNLAKQYGTGFWEVSASEDYHSTHGPLNSLIVESYLNTITLKNTSKNTSKNSTASAPCSLKGHENNKPRTKSEVLSLSNSKTSFESFDSEYDEDISPTYPIISTSEKRKNKNNSERKKLELKLGEQRVKKVSVGTLSLDNFLMTDNNNNRNNLSSPDPRNENSTLEPIRSSSWSRRDKKRSSIRKNTEKKEGTAAIAESSSSLKKSHSYSDLKSWEKQQTNEITPTRKDSRVQQLAQEIDHNNGYKDRTGTDAEFPTPCALLSIDTKPETASFSKLSTYTTNEPLKSPRARKERRKTTGLTVPIDTSDNELKSPDSERAPIMKIKRGEKRSVRRKISSIFRGPKIVLETQ